MPPVPSVPLVPSVLSPPHLLNALRMIVGQENLISGDENLLVYECDAYTLEKHLPTLVVLPQTVEQVVAIVKLCAKNKLPIIPRGAGTSLSGAVLAVEDRKSVV